MLIEFRTKFVVCIEVTFNIKETGLLNLTFFDYKLGTDLLKIESLHVFQTSFVFQAQIYYISTHYLV